MIAISVYVSIHPFIPEDAAVERDAQSMSWGPLALTFPFYSWIGDTKGAIAEGVLFIVILVVNRPAWLVAAIASLTGLWYQLLSHLIHRPRPTTPEVLRVTEHPGAWSFPSGHTIFVTTIVLVIVLCLVYRFVHGPLRIVAWLLAAAVIFGAALSRIDTGAHWPTDVLAGLLIAGAWMSVWLSFNTVSRRLSPRTELGDGRTRRAFDGA